MREPPPTSGTEQITADPVAIERRGYALSVRHESSRLRIATTTAALTKDIDIAILPRSMLRSRSQHLRHQARPDRCESAQILVVSTFRLIRSASFSGEISFVLK